MASEIVNQLIPVDACSPHPMNYQIHPEEQIADLALSLKRFGQVKSIVVQDAGEDLYLLVAGHGVHMAAQRAGLEELRADVIPADWPEAKVLAYLGADNELPRQASPDEAQLAALVQKVTEEADEELAKLAAGGESRLTSILANIEPYGDTSTDRYGQGVSTTWNQVKSATAGKVIIDDIETRLPEDVISTLKMLLIDEYEQYDKPIHETLEAVIVAGVRAVEACDH